jgi:hypothetical protein
MKISISHSVSISFLNCLCFPLLLIDIGSSQTHWIVSEVMADPAAVFDSHGEFLELAYIGPKPDVMDSLSIRIDGKDFGLKTGRVGANAMLMVCRDSIPATNGGLICHAQISALNLANGRPLSIELSQNGSTIAFPVPASRSGISWENTFDPALAYQSFLAASEPWGDGDSATPGQRNSCSVQAAQRDLGITKVTIDSENRIRAEVRNFGIVHPAKTSVSFWMDSDWDGEFESLWDSLSVPDFKDQPNLQEQSAFPSIPISNEVEARGLVQVRLSGDENLSNNKQQILFEPDPAIELTEWCPTPEPGRPEWIEIKNVTADITGQGRRLNLAGITLNGISLGKAAGDLLPGEYLVVTENKSRFQSQYGNLKLRLLELAPWPGLRNTGDTLKLAVFGYTLDSVVYASKDIKGQSQCLSRIPGALQAGSGSPGFMENLPAVFTWEISGRVCAPGKSLNIKVQAPSELSYALRVFDLDGNCVRNLGGGTWGEHVYAFEGRDDQGHFLIRGAYVLGLSSEGHKPKRAVIAVTGR